MATSGFDILIVGTTLPQMFTRAVDTDLTLALENPEVNFFYF